MTQSVRSHTGPTALIKLAQDVLNTEIAGLAAVRDRLNSPDAGKSPPRPCAGVAGGMHRACRRDRHRQIRLGRPQARRHIFLDRHPGLLPPSVEGAHGDLGSLRKDDVIIAISNSGETAELNAILPALKSLGTSLIAMTGREDSTGGLPT